MASKSHDPSSSDLLTDFDISDVVNWEEQTYGPKSINFNELLNSHGNQQPPNERSKARPSHHDNHYMDRSRGLLQEPTTSHSSMFGNESMKTDSNNHNPLFPESENVDLPPITPPCVSPDIERHPLHSSVFGSNSHMNDSEQDGLSFSGLEALQKISSEPLDRPSNEPTGLEALRAEVDNVTSYQNKKEVVTPTTATRNSPSSFLNAFSPQSASVNTTLQSPTRQQQSLSTAQTHGRIEQQKPQTTAPQTTPQQVQQIVIPDGQLNSNPVYIQLPGVGGKGQNPPLKGQLVKTADQKLMFVTEIGGKKVGYFIRQPNLTTSAPPTASSSAIVTQPQMNASPIVSTTPSPISSNNSTVIISDDSVSSPNKKIKLDSSDDDTTPLSRVAESLKNTSISPPGKKGRKKKEKVKKKKDPRKPTKPVTAYQFFFKDIQASIRQQNPTASFGEVSKIVSQMWENLPFASRKGYQEKGDAAKEEYLTKLHRYRSILAQENLLSPQMNSPKAIESPTTSQQSPEVKFVDERTDIPFDLNIHNYSNATTASNSNSENRHSPIETKSDNRFATDPDNISLGQDNEMQMSATSTGTIPTRKKNVKEKKTKLQQQLQIDRKKSIGSPSAGSPTCLTVPKKIESPDLSNQTSPTSKFKIPKKNEPKLSNVAENGVSKPSSAKSCVCESCSNPCKHSRERGSAYCSTDCLILHCKNSFSSWVIDRQSEVN